MNKYFALLIAFFIIAQAESYSAVNAFIKITADKQGVLKGEASSETHKDKMEVLSFSYGVVSPRDVASGQATGKRQHQPIRIIKEWGAATPQLFQALVTNERLPSVTIEFYHADSLGMVSLYHVIRLTNAYITGLRQFKDPADANGNSPELEEVSFTYQKIEMENKDGKTMASDDWSN
jgi:type VI secretion system secreted protein Hcp